MSDPTPSVHWAALWDFVSSGFVWLWSLLSQPSRAVSGCHSAARAVYGESPKIVNTGILVAAAGLLVFAVGQHGCTLPTLPPWPWWNPTPGPITPLEKSFHDAYAAETDPAKADHVAKLASITDVYVQKARATGTVTTAGQLYDGWHAAANADIGDGVMLTVRKAVGAYLDTKLPTNKAAPMTADLWNTAASEFAVVAAALKRGAK